MIFIEREVSVDCGQGALTARVRGYIPDCPEEQPNRNRPAMLILPGGGYSFTSEREAEPIALKFVSEGICAFVLNYSIAPAKFPQALCETLQSVAWIREQANTYRIDSNNIGVCGFSAGGHLAATAGVFWNQSVVDEFIGNNHEARKVNKMILSYPVISWIKKAHTQSFYNLLGESPTEEKGLFLSAESQVSEDTPSAFIWHTADDDVVPVQNSLMMANALIEAGKKVDLHIYRSGSHGLSLGNHLVDKGRSVDDRHKSSEWIDKAIDFVWNS